MTMPRMVLLRKTVSRMVGEKEYHKWSLNLPSWAIAILQCKESTELDIVTHEDGKSVILRRKQAAPVKVPVPIPKAKAPKVQVSVKVEPPVQAAFRRGVPCIHRIKKRDGTCASCGYKAEQ